MGQFNISSRVSWVILLIVGALVLLPLFWLSISSQSTWAAGGAHQSSSSPLASASNHLPSHEHESERKQRPLVKVFKVVKVPARVKKGEVEKLDKLEAGLASARALIREAIVEQNQSRVVHDDPDYVPRGDIYRNPYVFHRGPVQHGLIGGPPPLSRLILAFFAGRLHGRIRPTLLHHWKEKDSDVRVYETLPQGVSYQDMMKKTKYCICPSGHEVASPRIVEAIYAECVPVLISESYILPFSDVLNWDSFSVQVSVSEIPDLKKILMGIPEDRYLRMQERVKQVQRHFVVNDPPSRYDVFHMIIHSVWLRRLNVQISK